MCSNPKRARLTGLGVAWRVAALAVVAFAATGCGLFGPDSPREELEDARERWESQGIADYRVEYRRICNCLPRLVRRVRITVEGGEKVEIIYADDGEPVDAADWRHFLAIDELFDEILSRLNQHPRQFDASYHDELGYPTRVEIDQRQTADDEFVYEASALEPL